jgi:O-antigen/teichoic acid export membrane protein
MEAFQITTTIDRLVRERLAPHQNRIMTFSSLVFANVLAAAAGWMTQIHIANTLGKEIFGQVAFAVAIGTFGQVIIRVGLDRTLVRDLIHFPDRFSDLVQASLYLRYAIALVILCGLLIWKFLHPGSMSWGVVLIAMGSSVMSLDLQPVYDVWHKMQRHTVYYLIQRACYLLLVWAALLIFQSALSVLWIGAVTVISVILYLVLQHRWAFQHMDREGKKSFTELAGSIMWLIRHNLLVWLSAIFGLSIVMLNQVLLKRYSGFAELGVYAVAWQLVMIGTLLIEQISRIGRPAMARITRQGISRQEQSRFILQYAAVMAGVVIPLVGVMVFSPNIIITLLFRSEYHAATSILPILGVYLLLYSVGIVLSQYVLSVRLERDYLISVVLGGALSIGLCPLLIARYGISGAAVALLIAHGATITAYAISTMRYIRR